MNELFEFTPNPLLAARNQTLADSHFALDGNQPERRLNRLFEDQVSRSPESVALVFEDQSLSYAELNRRANRLAHYLRALGVGPEALVAICAEPCVEMIAAILAVLKAGGAYLPLDPAFPVERLRFMLEDSAPLALLTQSHLRSHFPELQADLKVLDLSAANPPWTSFPEFNPDAECDGPGSASLAQVIYTSGSTGRPKGVLLEHRALAILALWYIQECCLDRDFVSLPVTSFSFSAFYKNIYGPLFSGGRIHLMRNLKDTSELLSTAARENVRILNLTPTALSMFVDADQKGVLSSIRTIMLVGEPIQLHKLSALPSPRPEIINTYGQAESGLASFHRIPPGCDLTRETWSSIGRPFPFARIYILSEAGDPVPAGTEGELYIASACMSRGYLHRPELTAQRFLPDPFSSAAGARMFKTGDRGRWLADGTIEFLGRNDFQVKIRGVRIELGEIEACLMDHPAVREAVVIVREDTPGDERLVAYYLPARSGGGTESAPNPEQLRRHAAARLPEHIVPAAYVRLDAWPRTPGGKLDRRALPPPQRDAYPGCDYEPPRDSMEAAMVEIWSSVLKLERIGRYDNFFLLGGNSLLGMQVAVRLRKVFGLEVPVSQIFANPTIGSFSKTVGALLQSMPGNADLLRILDEVEALPETPAEGAS